jgi:DNA-binding CsgD family transcriptional regulator
LKKQVLAQKLVDKWLSLKKDDSQSVNVENYINNTVIFNQFATSTKQFFYISNFFTKECILYSKNTDELFGKGFHAMQESDQYFIFRNLHIDQIEALYIWTDWLIDSYPKLTIDKQPHYEHFICNFNYQNPDTGKIVYFSSREVALEQSNTQIFPKLTMASLQDTEYLLNENAPFWFRISIDADKKVIYTYHSVKKKFVLGDILSDREFEFLSCFQSGMSLGEIAQKMKITYSTADNHRKNILAKLGARNPTAAISILKYAGIKF